MHEKKILNLDIRPANIFISKFPNFLMKIDNFKSAKKIYYTEKFQGHRVNHA